MDARERVGERFDLQRMLSASRLSWQAVERMAETFRPGLRESDARAQARRILDDLGCERLWHPTHIRFGSNTTKTFSQTSDGDPVLGEDDIYFIDIGPVFDGHEGDVGATFTTGADAGKAACAATAKLLFEDVSAKWRQDRLSGPSLYAYAAQRAVELGWMLNLGVKGHRVGDYPHSIHRGGKLGAFDGEPTPGVWILEIQIADASRTFGAFYEDLLI